MTHASRILTELCGRGVSVTIEGEILCLKPRRALDDALLARVREAKPAILEVLRKHPSNHAETPARMLVAATCWHCNDSGECNCVTCGVMRPSTLWTAGKCLACKPKARIQ